MLGEGWDAAAAVRALARAEEAVDAAVRLLLDAEAVQWTGPGAAAYRRSLEDATDDVRRSRAQLREATGVVTEHAAVRRAGLGCPPEVDLGWPAPRWLSAPQLGAWRTVPTASPGMAGP